MTKRFYVTTPIYYVNDKPHIGHTYTTIVADTLKRFYDLLGYETFFLTGTDEHGEKIVEAAKKAGQPTDVYVAGMSAIFKETWEELNLSNDAFIRTTDEGHIEVVQLILRRIYDTGDIYFGTYEGNYCTGCERFLTARELVDGKCPDHQVEPVQSKEENYFFRMGKYQTWLIEYIRKHPGFIRPERYRNEVLGFLSEPLNDLCISRPKSRLNWGIPLPFDENFVTYVWFDALINYVSALGYPEKALFHKFWPVANHLIAKDILKPHGIYWPIMLKAAGIEPCYHLHVHGYWNMDEGKISKSLGRVIDPLKLKNLYGLDAIRYFLMREMVFGLDCNFSEETLIARINADLANNLGNLFSRSLTMVKKYFESVIPEPTTPTEREEALESMALGVVQDYEPLMKDFSFHKALGVIWELVNGVNKYIDDMAPWALAKDRTDLGRLKTVMYCTLESLRFISILLSPFMPEISQKMLAQLGIKEPPPKFHTLHVWGGIRSGTKIGTSTILFPRIDTSKNLNAKK